MPSNAITVAQESRSRLGAALKHVGSPVAGA